MRRLQVTKPFQGQGQLGLRLPRQVHPVRLKARQLRLQSGPEFRLDGRVFKEVAPCIQIQNQAGTPVSTMVFLPGQIVIHPAVHGIQRLDGATDIQVDTEVTQPAEAAHNAQRNVFIAHASGIPWPQTAGVLPGFELCQCGRQLLSQAVLIKQESHVSASLGFRVGLPDPGCFFEKHGLEILVLFQGTVQRICVLPLVKHRANPRIAVGDIRCQTVGIIAIEDLVRAPSRVFHEIGQGHDRVPCRL